MKKKINIFILIIIICLIISIILLNIISKKALPVFENYAISEIKNTTTLIINKSVTDKLKDFDDMIKISKNSKDEIQMIDFDSKIVNNLLAAITKEVLVNLKKLELGESLDFDKIEYSKGMMYEIPLGRISDNIFINNLGPKIPLKINIVNNIVSDIKTEIKEYGINNALVQISVNIEVSERVVMPFLSKTININTNVPISLKLIQGTIPEYYGGIFSRNSSILSIPTE